MADLTKLLATRDGRHALDRAVATLIRAEEHTEAEHLLNEQLALYPSELGDICLGLKADDVQVSGWDDLNTQIEVVSRGRKPCTAVGIDLSNHGDAIQTPEGWAEPGLECSYYSDSSFAFSTASRADILAQNETYGTPWQGSFEDIDGALTCTGLARLNSALVSHEFRNWHPGRPSPNDPEDAPVGFVAFVLGQWSLHLRFHQAMKRELEERGLARAIPVLVGGNDVGPHLEAVYVVTKVTDYSEAAENALVAQRVEALARYNKHTEKQIVRYREMRSGIRGWSWLVNRKQRRTLIDYYNAHEALTMKDYNLSLSTPSWKLADADFERYLDSYRKARYRAAETA